MTLAARIQQGYSQRLQYWPIKQQFEIQTCPSNNRKENDPAALWLFKWQSVQGMMMPALKVHPV
jgi:hypothetical protein